MYSATNNLFSVDKLSNIEITVEMNHFYLKIKKIKDNKK